MELLVAWGHLLHEVVSDGVSARDLGCGLAGVAVEVLDDRLFAGLIIHDRRSHFGLKSHCHSH